MSFYKNKALFLVICFFSVQGWSEGTVPDELKIILEVIELKVKKRQSSIDPAPVIIAIGGCPGVGKSTISQLLQNELLERGITSLPISLDHYGLSEEERKKFASELDPRRMKWNKLHATLKEICEGKKEIVKPVIHQLTKERSSEILSLEKVDCILFEGSYTLGYFAPLDFFSYSDCSLYLETSLENIYNGNGKES